MKKSALAVLFLVGVLVLSGIAIAAEEAPKAAPAEEAPKAAPAPAPAPVPKVAPAQAEAPVKAPTLKVGSKLDKLSVMDVDGGKATLDLGSGTTAISFFNTMCSACRQELGLLENLKKQKKDLAVAAISVDVEGKKTLEPFKEKNKYSFAYYLDPDFKTAEMFGLPYTPGLVVVKNGEIAYIKGGFVNSYADEIIKVILK